jgi:small subunit ribosomal protein S16
MPVKVRLMRIGSKKRPFFRVVAVDERKKRTGAYLELLGTYNPLTEPKDINLKQDRIDYWVGNGAVLSDGFLRIIGQAPQRPPRKPKKAQPEKQAPAEEKATEKEEAVEETSESVENSETPESSSSETEAKTETPVEEVVTENAETQTEAPAAEVTEEVEIPQSETVTEAPTEDTEAEIRPSEDK